MRFSFIFSVLLFVLAVARPSVAQDIDKGVEALLRGDFAAAVAEWKPLAEQGHAGAQLNLGQMYEVGAAVPQSDAQAVKWYRKAADQGDDAAQYRLGLMYELGRGVPRSDSKAVEWYLLAANQGLPEAQHNLAVMYAVGAGVVQDDVKATELFRAAAIQAHVHAQYMLGGMYRIGRGVAQDDTLAHMWLDISSAQGVLEAGDARNALAKQMSPQAVAKAQALARECLASNYANCP